jgi:hypothetical protein
MRVQKATKDLPGVMAVEARVEDKSATFELENLESLPRVQEVLMEIGYPGEQTSGE